VSLTDVDAAQDRKWRALYELDVASGATRALTDGAAFDTESRFSPDRRFIALFGPARTRTSANRPSMIWTGRRPWWGV